MFMKTSNRIVFFHPADNFTGSTHVLANVIETDYTGKVYVVTEPNNGGFLSDLPNVKILPLWVVKRHGLNSITWRLSWILWSIVCLFKFDTYYINTVIPYYPAFFGRLFQKKVIYHVHEKSVTNEHTYRVAEYVFNHVKCTKIFVSNYVKSQYPEVPGCKSIVKYNKLSPSYMSGVEMVPVKKRKRKNVLMVASLTKIKGVAMLVDVAKELPEFNFVLILSATTEQIDEYFGKSLPNNLTIYPKQSDVRPFIKATDLMLNLSHPFLCVETFGLTILESMPFGVPAVVPNVGGPLELVDNGVNGFCVDTSNKEEICEAIKKCLSAELYPKLCEGALLKFKELNGK